MFERRVDACTPKLLGTVAIAVAFSALPLAAQTTMRTPGPGSRMTRRTIPDVRKVPSPKPPAAPLSAAQKQQMMQTAIHSFAEQNKAHPEWNLVRAVPLTPTGLNPSGSPFTLTAKKPFFDDTTYLLLESPLLGDYPPTPYVARWGNGPGTNTGGPNDFDGLLHVLFKVSGGKVYLLDFTLDRFDLSAINVAMSKMTVGILLPGGQYGITSVSMEMEPTAGHLLVPIAPPVAGRAEIVVACRTAWQFSSVDVTQLN